ADRRGDPSETLLPPLAVRHDVVGVVQIELVDFLLGYELVDVNHSLALDGDRLELLRSDFEVFALAGLVALDDVLLLDFLAGFDIDLAVFDPVAGLLVDLMEADFFPLRRRREQGDGTGDKRQFEVTLPVCTRRHDKLHQYAWSFCQRRARAQAGVFPLFCENCREVDDLLTRGLPAGARCTLRPRLANNCEFALAPKPPYCSWNIARSF